MRRILAAGVALAVLAGPADAQSRTAVELRGGFALPTADFGGSDLEPGGGLGLTAVFRFMPHTMLYGGWDWYRLVTDEPFEGTHFDVENTGYTFGLQFQHPLVRTTEWWVRAGGIYNHAELEDDDGDILGDSGHELGWEAGAGLSIPLTRGFAITPGLRYRSFSGEINVGTGDVPFDMSYLAFEVGFGYRFGTPAVAAIRR